MSYTASYIVNSSSAQGTTDFQFTFPYIQEDHIEVYVNYNKITQGSGSNQYQVITNVSPKLIRLNTGIASANLRVEVLRNSSLGTPIVDYADGSTLTANDLDTSALQSLYIDQELKDSQDRTVTVDEATGLPTLNDQRLTDVADPVAAQDAATKNYVDTNDNLQLSRSGGTMTGDIATGGNRITGLPNPASGSEPVIKSYFEAQSWDNTTETIDSTETWAGNNTKIATTGAIDGRIDSKIDTAIEGDVLAGTDLTKTQTGGQVTLNHAVFNPLNTNNQLGSVVQNITINARGHVTGQANLNLDTRYYTKTELDAGQLSGQYYTEAELDAGQLDNRYYTETEADARFYNLDSGEEIRSGETWSAADNKIATTAAIDARIVDLVEEVGGFVPIANETSFPTANPDINNGTGTLVSVQVLASSHTPSGGNVTISNGAGSGNTVTITGCGSTVLAAGYGLLLETTSTLHTYTFHRLTPKATEVSSVAGNNTNINTVATNINDVITVANDLNESTSEINTVANDIANVNTVGNAIANVNTAATNIANINTVASDLNETTSEIDTVATNIANVNTVGTSIANVNTVANDLNETTSEIDTVAVNIANVNIVGNAITNVNNVGGSITDVNTVATNLADVSNYADRYQIASSDPSARADSSSLQEGDQYFNTTANVLKVYDGSNWNTGVTDTTGFAVSTGQTFTGNVGVPAATSGAPGLFIAGDTDTGIYSPGANLLAITASGTKVLEAGSSGITITGTVAATSFTGDGSSLSGINTDLVADTTPQLGGNLDVNGKNILFGDSSDGSSDDALQFGAGIDLTIYSDGNQGIFDGDIQFNSSNPIVFDKSDNLLWFKSNTNGGNTSKIWLGDGPSYGNLLIQRTGSLGLISVSNMPLELNTGTNLDIYIRAGKNIDLVNSTGSTNYWVRCKKNSGSDQNVELYYGQGAGAKKLETTNTGVTITGTATATTFSGSGASLTNIPAANITGTLPAISGANLTNVDADLWDGNQFSSYLNQAVLTTSNPTFATVRGDQHTLGSTNNNNAYLKGTGGGAQGLVGLDSGGNFKYQIYGDGAYYGFLDGTWAGWDLRKQAGGQLEVRVSGTLYTVWHQGNDGSGSGLDADTVDGIQASSFLRSDTNDTISSIPTFANCLHLSNNNSWSGETCKIAHHASWLYLQGGYYGFAFRSEGGTDRWYINSSGHFQPATDSTYDIGITSKRVRNVYADTLYGDGSNLTNLPAGGAAFTATASGALAANKAVMVNSNGTVTQIDTTTTAKGINTSTMNPSNQWQRHWNRSGQLTGGDMCYDRTHDKIVMVDGQGFEASLMHVYTSGRLNGSISWTSLNVSTSGGMEFMPKNIYSPDNGLVLCVLGAYDVGQVKLIEPTGASGVQTFGMNISSGHVFRNTNGGARYCGGCYDTNVNKFIICYADSTNSYRGYIRTVTVSGTNSSASVSFGSETQFESSDVRYCKLVFDENANRSYLVYTKTNNTIYYRYITVSGTNITLGSQQTVTSGFTSQHYMQGSTPVYNSTDNILVVGYASNNGYWRGWRAIAGTPGSSSISWGSSGMASDTTETQMNGDMAWDGKANQFWCCYRSYPGSGTYLKGNKFTVNTSTLAISQGAYFDDTSYYNQDKCVMLTNPKESTYCAEGVVWVNYNAGSNGHTYSFISTDTKSNLPGPNYFVGFPKQAYSNGQTATIQTYGSVVEGFSGLKPGWPYFVHGDGSVGLSPGNSQQWPTGDGFTWDNSTNQRHVDAENSWNPNASSATSTMSFSNSPLAGLALGTDKILLTANVHHRSPYANYQNNNHTHGG